MQRISLYSKQDLAPIVAQGTANVSAETWVANMLGAFARVVKKRPLAYRQFGIYWWPIKKLLIEAGAPYSAPEDSTVQAITFGDPVLDVAAAFAYQEQASENLTAMASSVTVMTEDGDLAEFEIRDEELENLATN